MMNCRFLKMRWKNNRRQAITACLFKSMLNLSFFFAMVAQISRTILWNNLHKLIIIIRITASNSRPFCERKRKHRDSYTSDYIRALYQQLHHQLHYQLCNQLPHCLCRSHNLSVPLSAPPRPHLDRSEQRFVIFFLQLLNQCLHAHRHRSLTHFPSRYQRDCRGERSAQSDRP